MKIIVAHASPDLDAITSVWLLHRFFPGWEDAEVKFVSAGERIDGGKYFDPKATNPIEEIEENQVIHVDTGLGPLDHHQTSDENVCAASRTWEYVQKIPNSEFKVQDSDRVETKKEAISRMVKVVVAIDHFKEVFWPDANADYLEFSLFGILEGIKMQKPNQDTFYVAFVEECLDALMHNFENKIWAEKEIKESGKEFESRFGKGIGFESLNDAVLKISQKMGYMIVVRKDPRKGYVRIKARPFAKSQETNSKLQKEENIDLTPVYEKLKTLDPEATWFLHVSKKMLLNGTSKNPKMKPSSLSLDAIIDVIKEV